MGKLIIDGNEVYEIDEECMKKKEAEKKKRTAPEKRRSKILTQERILLAGFSACGGSLQRHNSSWPQCDPARRAFCSIGNVTLTL